MTSILVVADLDQTEPHAFLQAQRLAEGMGASMHVVWFAYARLRQAGDQYEPLKQSIIDGTKQRAEAFLEEQNTGEILVTHDVVWAKNIHEWVEDYTGDNDVALVVKTAHRTESMFHTPSDWKLLRHSSVPVFLSHPQHWQKAQHLLVAVDLETTDELKLSLNHRLLSMASQWAKLWGVECHIVYVPYLSPIVRDLGIAWSDNVEDEAKENLASECEALCEQYGVDKAHVHIHAGLPHQVIPSLAAKLNVDTVFIGTMGRQGLAAGVIGNTAEQTMSLLKTHVLAMKPASA